MLEERHNNNLKRDKLATNMSDNCFSWLLFLLRIHLNSVIIMWDGESQITQRSEYKSQRFVKSRLRTVVLHQMKLVSSNDLMNSSEKQKHDWIFVRIYKKLLVAFL